MLIWLDLETTGLDYINDRICEVGVILTTDDLAEIDRFQAVIQANAAITECLERNEFVRNMHTENGLIEEMKLSRMEYIDVEGELDSWLTGHNATGSPLAGNTVHFDRSFLLQQMPVIASHFHYRNFDVSAINQMARLWSPTINQGVELDREIHRAIPDLEDSLATAAGYRDWLFTKAEQLYEGN